MLTIRQYNKIMHDWIMLLVGLSGSMVRPQKDKFGFALTDNQGRPISFEGSLAMFYFGFESDAMDRYYTDNDTAKNLKRATLKVTFVGDTSEQLGSQFMATCLGSQSRQYLSNYGFAIMGNPQEVISDKDYSSKWFRRRTINVSLNCSIDFVPACGNLSKYIQDIPYYTNKN